jgi:hypothetical protein
MSKVDNLVRQKKMIRAFWRLQELRSQNNSGAETSRNNNLQEIEKKFADRSKNNKDLLDLITNLEQKANQELNSNKISSQKIDDVPKISENDSDPEAKLHEIVEITKVFSTQISKKTTILVKNKQQNKTKILFRTVAFFILISICIVSANGGIYFYDQYNKYEVNYQLLMNYINGGKCKEALALYQTIKDLPIYYKDFQSKLSSASGPEAIIIQYFVAYQRNDQATIENLTTESTISREIIFCGGIIQCLSFFYSKEGQLIAMQSELVSLDSNSGEVILDTTWTGNNKACQQHFYLERGTLWQVSNWDTQGICNPRLQP